MFQYKILHRFLGTNSLLYKCKLKETHLCSFCNETKETILHLFWECPVVKNFWIEIRELFKNRCNVILPNTADQIILGSEISDISINFFIVLIKYYIYSCKCTGTNLSPLGAQTMLKQTYLIEKLSSTFSQSPAVGQKINSKWANIEQLL